MKLCSECGREFVPKKKIISQQRYGKPLYEKEMESDMCDDCRADLGEDENEEDEDLKSDYDDFDL